MSQVFHRQAKIFVAGHRGLVGSSLVRALGARGFSKLVLRTHSELDLTEKPAVDRFFEEEHPEIVFMAAAKVGGIHANRTHAADFLRINLEIQNNLFYSAQRYGTKKLLFLGSSCIYPKHAPQPIKEEHLLTGPLEPTNEAYAIAKIAGILACRAYNRQYGTRFIAAMPTNLYGPGDNFDLQQSHVLPAMIRKFQEARASGKDSVELWGSGTPRREFLHVDDLARACLLLMERFEPSDDVFLNVGTGTDVTVRELADLIASIVGFRGHILWNRNMPDGTPRKLLDVSRLSALGFAPQISLRQGIEETYRWYLQKTGASG